MNTVAKLTMEVSARAVKAHLVIANTSDQDIYLEKYKVFNDGEVDSNSFKITVDGRYKVPYVGKMIKRRSPMLEDFLKLGPGEQYEQTVDLNKVYEFPSGTHSYGIYYSALHATPNSPDGIWELRSDEVVFALTR